MAEDVQPPAREQEAAERPILRALIVENSEEDAILIERILRRARFDLRSLRVDTPETLRNALLGQAWDIILSDHSMPQLDSFKALSILKELGRDIPFILISGSIGEDMAVRVMRSGANDYIMKDHMARLAPAVERELREAASRQARRKAEQAQRVSERRFRELVEQIPAVTYIAALDEDRTIFYVSPQIEKVLGLKISECRHLWAKSLYPDDRARVAQELAYARENRIPFRSEYRMVTPDGRILWFHDDALVMNDEEGKPGFLRGFMQDITDRRNAEESLRERDEQLRKVQKLEAIGRLAGGIAHDFNNLLTPILSYGKIMQDTGELNPDMKLCADEIVRASERAAILTRQLLTFGRKQMSQARPLVINQIVVDMGRFLRRTISEDIELETHLQEDIGWIEADPVHVEQVIMNLSLNARDAMPKGGRLIIATENATLTPEDATRHPGAAAGEFVCLTIRDNGAGMSDDVREHAFEPFFTTKAEGKGTGLGLSIVFGIVQQCRGSIQLQTEVGRGTSFRLYFPRIKARGVTVIEKPKTTTHGGKESILVAEDEEAVRRLAVRVLTSLGYDITEAASGAEAIAHRLSRGRPFDMILTDVVMPKMSGRELVEELEKLGDKSKVVFMSGFTQDDLVLRGVRHETQPLLMKPYTREDLAQIVRQVLDRA